MRGDPQAISGRLLTNVPSRRWQSRIGQMIREQRRVREERLEVSERLAREQRRARHTGRRAADLMYRIRRV
jgi:hypothetical protein